jgi:hypothetical protein
VWGTGQKVDHSSLYVLHCKASRVSLQYVCLFRYLGLSHRSVCFGTACASQRCMLAV